MQALLNEDLEIKIEGIIYKLLDAHRTIVITDGDFSKLDIIRQDPENYTPQENIFTHDELNPRMDDYINLFDEEGNKSLFSCVASFYPVNIAPHNFTFLSNSFFIIGNMTYNWDFGDGTTFSGTGSQGMSVNHSFNPNNYPYTVTLEISAASGCSSTYSYVMKDPNNCSASLNVRRIPDNGKAFRFIAYDVVGSGLQYTWDFGNGSSVTTTQPEFIYTYPTDGNYQVNLTISDGSCSYSTPVIDISARCGGRTDFTSSDYYESASNSMRQLLMENFVVDAIFWDKVGNTTYNYEDDNGWKLKKADEVIAHLDVDHATIGNGCEYADGGFRPPSKKNRKQATFSYKASQIDATLGSFGVNFRNIRVSSQTPFPSIPPGTTPAPNPANSDMNSAHWIIDNGTQFGIGNLIF